MMASVGSLSTQAGGPGDAREPGAGTRPTGLARYTGMAIIVLLAALVVQVMFESWVQALTKVPHFDPDGKVAWTVDGWPKAIKSGLYITLALVTVAHVLIERTWRRFTAAADIALLGLVAVLAVAGLVNGSSALLTGQGIFVFFRGAIVFYALRALDPPWPRLRKLLWLAGGLILLNAIIGIVQSVIGFDSYQALGWFDVTWANLNRAHALMEHPNHLGHVTGLMMLGVLAWLLVAPERKRRWWVLFVVLSLALAATQSRESFLAFAGGAVLMVVLRRARYKVFAIALTLVLVGTAAQWLGRPDMRDELLRRLGAVSSAIDIGSGEEEGRCPPDTNPEDCSTSRLPRREIRVLYIQQGLRLWADAPVLGYGVGQFGGIVAWENDHEWYKDTRFGPEGFNMHGFQAKQVDLFWLHLLVEVGAVGTLAYLLWYVLLGAPQVRAARRRVRSDQSGARFKDEPLFEERPYWAQMAILWAPAALIFGAAIACLSPALEDPLFPPLMFGVLGLGWLGLTARNRGSDGPDPAGEGAVVDDSTVDPKTSTVKSSDSTVEPAAPAGASQSDGKSGDGEPVSALQGDRDRVGR